jgi:protocatechuate 3,4-dioxygenase beta subunit
MAQAHGQVGEEKINPYKIAEFSEADSERVKPVVNGEDRLYNAAGNSIEFLSLEHAVKVLDLKEGSGPVEVNLTVDPGKAVKVNVVDAEGKPLEGAAVSGVTATWPLAVTLKSSSFTAYALDPARPRTLLFLEPKRGLGATLKVSGDEKEPPTVKLVPAGTLTGRVLDSDGRPVAGAEVEMSFSGQIGNELQRLLRLSGRPATTDADGKFRLGNVVPGVKVGLNIRQGQTYLIGEPRIGQKTVNSGQVLDMGDLKTKPYRP